MLDEGLEDDLVGLDALGVGEENLMILLEPGLSGEALGTKENEIAKEDKKAEDNASGDSQLEAFLVLAVLLLRIAELHGDGVLLTIEDGVERESCHCALAKRDVLVAIQESVR